MLAEEAGDTEGEAEPHDRVCETDERLDWAVDDFSFRTRLVFGFGADEDDELEVTAQFNGIEELLLLLAAGSDG